MLSFATEVAERFTDFHEDTINSPNYDRLVDRGQRESFDGIRWIAREEGDPELTDETARSDFTITEKLYVWMLLGDANLHSNGQFVYYLQAIPLIIETMRWREPELPVFADDGPIYTGRSDSFELPPALNAEVFERCKHLDDTVRRRLLYNQFVPRDVIAQRKR
jgi:hypothetical protein